MSNRFRKLNMEKMEDRQMMAGDITASVVNGNLFLNEADGQAGLDNSVVISQIAPGQIRVTGNTFADGTTSHINGAASQDFTVTGSLSVNFGGGSDLVMFNNLAPPSFQNVNLNMGAPTSQPLNTPDVDNVMIFGGKIRGSLTVNTARATTGSLSPTPISAMTWASTTLRLIQAPESTLSNSRICPGPLTGASIFRPSMRSPKWSRMRSSS